MSPREFIENLNRTYFGGRLSAAVCDGMAALPVERADARAMIERVCRLMHRSGLPAEDVSAFHGGMLGSLISRLLPGNWEGRVPPITVAGRHRRIDQLVNVLFPAPGRMIDVACGFPPVTTIDSAAALPGWEILGVDRALPHYLVYDGLGNYCVFDDAGRATYFQPVVPTGDSWAALLADWEASRKRFEALLQTLLASAAPSPEGAHPDAGATLSIEPAHAYERPGLRFLRSDLADLTTAPATVVRCFNMLMYFDAAFRAAALPQFAALLADDGLLVCGTDWAGTVECRYFTYRKRGAELVPHEFAFSVDNVAPFGIVTYYALQDDDTEVETLSRLCAILRADRAFTERFGALADRLRLEYGLSPRGADGYHGELSASVDPSQIWQLSIRMSDELGTALASHAAEVLGRHGYRARVNEVGHVAVALS
jgi:hypothetical protein